MLDFSSLPCTVALADMAKSANPLTTVSPSVVKLLKFLSARTEVSAETNIQPVFPLAESLTYKEEVLISI